MYRRMTPYRERSQIGGGVYILWKRLSSQHWVEGNIGILTVGDYYVIYKMFGNKLGIKNRFTTLEEAIESCAKQ
jgi:hypothetical protein